MTTAFKEDPVDFQHIVEDQSRRRSSIRKGFNKDEIMPSEDRSNMEEADETLNKSSSFHIMRTDRDATELGDVSFSEEKIIERTTLQFKDFKAKLGRTATASAVSTGGFWRLESPDIFKGGPLQWNQPYRLKNLSTNRYLKITKSMKRSNSQQDTLKRQNTLRRQDTVKDNDGRV